MHMDDGWLVGVMALGCNTIRVKASTEFGDWDLLSLPGVADYSQCGECCSLLL